MFKLSNSVFEGSDGRKSLIDLQIPDVYNGHLIVFIHGFMGYKDWGAWHLVQDFFVEKGYAFCKFNMTHNGGTVENPIDFPDEQAFSENTYSKEVADLGHALHFAKIIVKKRSKRMPKITLMGHSRGGGVALLKAKDFRVHHIVTLAGISSIGLRFSDPKMLADWKEMGVKYVSNQRTKQNLPQSYEQVTDFLNNQETLSIEKACKKLFKPVLHIHGDQDVSVPLWEGDNLAAWTRTKLQVIEGADHVFGSSQPWKEKELPPKLKEACDLILDFFKNHSHLYPW